MMNKEENNKQSGRRVWRCAPVALNSHSSVSSVIKSCWKSISITENNTPVLPSVLCFGELMMSRIRGSNIMRCSHFLNCPSYWMDGNCAWNEVLHTIHEIMGWSSKEMLINQLPDQQNLLFGCPALTSWWARLLRLGLYSVMDGEMLFKNVQLHLLHYCSKVVGLLNHFCNNSIITNFIK